MSAVSSFGKTFKQFFLALIVPAWLFQYWLEVHESSDALGFWYVAYCGIAWAALGAVLLATTTTLLGRKKSS